MSLARGHVSAGPAARRTVDDDDQFDPDVDPDRFDPDALDDDEPEPAPGDFWFEADDDQV